MIIQSEKIIDSELKQLLHDIYLIGQESQSIHTNDFIKIIENKLLSLISNKN